jgi:hypothetical protein
MDWYTVAVIALIGYFIYWMESIHRILKTLYILLEGWSTDFAEMQLKTFPPREATVFDLDDKQK